MILLDYPTSRTKGYCHLVGSSIEELHEFAKLIGLKRSWFENKIAKNIIDRLNIPIIKPMVYGELR